MTALRAVPKLKYTSVVGTMELLPLEIVEMVLDHAIRDSYCTFMCLRNVCATWNQLLRRHSASTLTLWAVHAVNADVGDMLRELAHIAHEVDITRILLCVRDSTLSIEIPSNTRIYPCVQFYHSREQLCMFVSTARGNGMRLGRNAGIDTFIYAGLTASRACAIIPVVACVYKYMHVLLSIRIHTQFALAFRCENTAIYGVNALTSPSDAYVVCANGSFQLYVDRRGRSYSGRALMA